MQKKAQILFVFATLLLSFGAHAQDREEAMVMSLGDSSNGKLSTTFFSISSVDNMRPGKADDGGRTWSGYNYFSLNYKIDQDHKLSFRLPFVYQTEGTDKYGEKTSQRADLQDIHIALSFYDLGYIGPVDLNGAIKFYLPTSQYSQDTQMYARLRGELFAEYHITRFSSIKYVSKPDIYFQGRTSNFIADTAQFDDGGYVTDPRQSTKQYSLEHYLELVADVNQYFALKPKAGFDEDWRYGSVANELEAEHTTKAVFALGLEVRPFRALNFTIAIQNENNLSSYKGKDIAWFVPENTSYTLMTNLFLFNL